MKGTRFGAGFMISKHLIEDARIEKETLVDHQKRKALGSLVEKIQESKSELWTKEVVEGVDEHDPRKGDEMYSINLYIFTPAEFRQVVEKIKRGEIA